MADKQTSTLQSYVDSATGAVQAAIGNLTGSNADQQAGYEKKDKAQAEHEASHATAKVGNLTASGTGAVTKDDPNRTEGSWNQTVGSGKEFVGNMLGAEGIKQAGTEQRRTGESQEAQGQLNDLAGGIADRATGAVKGAVAGVVGDRDAQARAQAQHDIGKTQQRGVEHDLDKQANANANGNY
ncbi:hypothetical protein F5884DRAFT_790792 [Xylogone sp. PMI_703]|nr:hypothetical protein F5884DRAFT_790792 [Xylogone sp. PMI_703]